MQENLARTLRRLTAKDGVEPSLTDSFFPRGKKERSTTIKLEPRSLIGPIEAEQLINNKLIGIEGTADDLKLTFDNNQVLYFSRDGRGAKIRVRKLS